MRAFLTGGTGFVGGAVARALRARGDEVVALVRDPNRAQPLADLAWQPRPLDAGLHELLAPTMDA